MGADGKGVFGFGFVGDGQGDDRCGSAGRWCDGQDRRKSTISLSRKRMTYGLKHFLGKTLTGASWRAENPSWSDYCCSC